MAAEQQIAEIIARRISVSNATLRAAGDVICLNGIKEAAQEIAARAAAEQFRANDFIDLQVEWNRCAESYGHEPTYEQWHAWTLQLLRGERDAQVRANEEQSFLRRIVDKAWNACTESSEVPSTDWADRIIQSARI